MTVKIWNSQEPFKEVTTLSHKHYVWNVLKMKKRDVIVNSCTNSTVVFWSLKGLRKKAVQNVYVGTPCETII